MEIEEHPPVATTGVFADRLAAERYVTRVSESHGPGSTIHVKALVMASGRNEAPRRAITR
jgi:hypothetical protein